MVMNKNYDIALSFAGEDREYVDRVANLLRQRGVRVFYDSFEEADLWGKDLYTHLSEIYRERARFTVMFISEAYARKRWTNHERMAAQARAFQEAQEYILPARFDNTDIPGVLPTVGYISLKNRSPEDFVSIITKKLISSGGSVPTELVRGDFSSIARGDALTGSQFMVFVRDDEDVPIGGCKLALQAENGTFVTTSTGTDGVATFDLRTRRVSILLVSHPQFPAAVCGNVDPEGEIKITLNRMENIGSTIIDDTGYIPGLKGRLNPILDTSMRTYLYADNIAIGGGRAQPAGFKVNVPFQLEDADGVIVYVTIKHIAARLSLLQYTRKPE